MDFKVILKDAFLEDLERIMRLIAAHTTASQNLGEFITEISDRSWKVGGGRFGDFSFQRLS